MTVRWIMNQEMVTDIAACLREFNDALEARNAKALNDLTAPELSYGHSKGKIETREQFINNVISDGATQFANIVIEDQSIVLVNNNAIVRHTFKAQTSKNGVAGNVQIQNLMIWQKNDGQWRLIARQAFSF